MKNIEFGWSESVSPVTQLATPITRASVKTAAHGRPMVLTLWRSNGTGLRIQSKMHDLADRIEVGVLNFTRVDSLGEDDLAIALPAAFDAPLKVTKLVIVEAGTTVESGVMLESPDGKQIVVTAGAGPYTLAIRGIIETPHAFEPEYSIDNYAPVPLA